MDPRLLQRLACVECRAGDLAVEDPAAEPWELSIGLASYGLRCAACGTRYPVTDDHIPIMWTPALRGLFDGAGSDDTATVNAQVYDTMSDDYMTSTRQDEAIRRRIRSGVERILSRGARGARERTHLDWGCGPGHVLRWTQSLSDLRVGLDVSLANLRNTRRIPNTLVVLGDAQRMPFVDEAFDVVTESSVLHHVLDWRSAIAESARVCRPGGGILIDSEPSREQLDWSPLARWIFDSRWNVYHVLSYVRPSLHMFRDVAFAKRNYWEAEIHNQPGKGFDTGEVAGLFGEAGVDAQIIRSPTAELREGARPSWQEIVLHAASLQNPFDPRRGAFMVLAHKPARPD